MNIEWYLPDPNGMASLGPYETSDIIGFLETGKLRTDDFICAPSISGERWERVYRYEQFRLFLPSTPISPPPRIFSKGVFSSDIQAAAPLVHQSSLSLTADVVLHNNVSFQKGKTLEISEHSLFVEFAEGATATKGNEYFLTLFNCSSLPTFTCQAVLIDTKAAGDRLVGELYFIRLNPVNKKAITYFLSSLSASQMVASI